MNSGSSHYSSLHSSRDISERGYIWSNDFDTPALGKQVAYVGMYATHTWSKNKGLVISHFGRLVGIPVIANSLGSSWLSLCYLKEGLE